MDEKKEIGVYAPEVLGTAKLVGVFESGTSEWHKAREDGIGGSEVGAVLGLSQYESPFSLWAKKTGKVESDFVDNWSTRFGRAFEMPILKLWAEQHPDWEVFSTGTYSHAENPWMKANPDAIGRHRVTGELMVIEIKTARYSWNETPPAYQAQVMHYMDVLGIKRGIIVAVAGWNWVEIAVEYDEFLAAMNRTILKKFWWHVINDVAPEYDGADATYQAVRKMHPEIDNDVEIEIDGLHHLALAQKAADEAQSNLNKIKSEVMALMGNAKHAYVEHNGEKFRVASRQFRGTGAPFLVVKKGNE